ncbi:hypothetical protein RZN22_03430 [Bacillaceae bacterium S4-13-58]
MDPKEKKNSQEETVAPGIDEADSLGEDATPEEIAHGDSTTVFQFKYDEYDPSMEEDEKG